MIWWEKGFLLVLDEREEISGGFVWQRGFSSASWNRLEMRRVQ